MKRVQFLIILLLIPIFVNSAGEHEEVVDDIKINFEFNSPDEIISHYEAQIYYGVIFDFTLSKYQNVSSVIINNFTISYIAFEDDDRILFDHTTYLGDEARNTSDQYIFSYGKNTLEQLKSNPFTRSRIDVLVFVDFTIINLDTNSSHTASNLFSGPILVNPLSIADLMRYIAIIGSLLTISVLVILRKRRIGKTK